MEQGPFFGVSRLYCRNGGVCGAVGCTRNDECRAAKMYRTVVKLQSQRMSI
jgi:hypothetical protein